LKKQFSFLLLAILLSFFAMALASCTEDGGIVTIKDGSAILASGSSGGGAENEHTTAEEDPGAPPRDTTPFVPENVADGLSAASARGATVDYSHAADGYIMVRYDGESPRVKLQINKDGEAETYTYTIFPGEGYRAYPLSQGAGAYTARVFLLKEGKRYGLAVEARVDAAIADEFAPFLRPNHFADYAAQTEAVALAAGLAEGPKSDQQVIDGVFAYVTGNIRYDYEKAETVEAGYRPSVDETLASGEGICFDYASLMTCMLRSQRIPCKLVVGYADETYHAWVSVYTPEAGWVLMDPTFAAGGNSADPALVGSGKNYAPLYYY
jgi:transglutaminase-like putative cysteine protease